jgi:hypothetical protein
VDPGDHALGQGAVTQGHLEGSDGVAELGSGNYAEERLGRRRLAQVGGEEGREGRGEVGAFGQQTADGLGSQDVGERGVL